MNDLSPSPLLSSEQLGAEQLALLDRADSKVVPGRACGSCNMCCKATEIPDLQKPAGKWCQHCKPGKGCGVHAMRPFVCRGFYCEWMISKGLGPEWKPDRSKFLLARSSDGLRLTATIDPGYPAAWRASPYYQNFKIWAAEGARKDPIQLVGVMNGEHLTVVLPDRDVTLGVLAPDEVVTVCRDSRGMLSVEKTRRAG